MGAVILETSKIHMYQFWYDYLKVKYGNKIQLIHTDTDSFVIEVETYDIYEDMLKYSHLYDFSDYSKNRSNFSLTNKKVYGIFKDDLNGKIITEFTTDKPKMYSYTYIDNYKDMLMNCEPDEYELIQYKMCSNENIDNYAILNRKKKKRKKRVFGSRLVR